MVTTPISTCRMEVAGNVPSFDITISDSTVEVGVVSLSHYLDTAHELLGIVSRGKGRGREREEVNGDFRRYVSKPDLSEGRLMSVAREIGSHSTRISKQALERGRGSQDETDSG